MNIIQTIRSWFFGKEETIETPETPVVEAPVETKPLAEVLPTYVTKEEVAAMVKQQEEAPKLKPKRKYNKKKKSSGEAK